MQLILKVTCLLATLGPALTVSIHNLGNGDLYNLTATQDTWLESGSRNGGGHEYLIVGKHPQYPNKRSLVQFEGLPDDCTTIQWAKMYLYFVYAHKASWQSVDNVPYIERDLQVHQVNKPWNEYQTTSTYQYRNSGIRWNTPYLAVDGSEAAYCTQDTVTVFTARPHGYMEFDVTEAVQNWKSGQPNYGLLVLATNEEAEGRDLRFYSRNAQDYHPYVAVLCNGAEDAAENQNHVNENPTCAAVFNSTTETTVEIPTTSQSTPTSENPTLADTTTLNNGDPVVSSSNYGNGDFYRLTATQDTWLESNGQYGGHQYLIVGKHPQYPKKRSLVQFADLPNDCTTIKWAKMYLYFVYAHKASGQSVDNVPYIERDIQVHQVKKPWDEYQTTSFYQDDGIRWNASYLALDGSDVAQCVQDIVTVFTARPRGYMEFDVTEAVRNWKSGQPNYGLLVLATNEEAEGRDLRFYSRNAQDYHPYVAVLCNGAEDAVENQNHVNGNPTCAAVFNSTTETTVEIPTTSQSTPTSENPTLADTTTLNNGDPVVSSSNYGNGDFYRLTATQDTWLESNGQYGGHQYLIVGKHPQYPNKRFLVQFEGLPDDCTTIQWAKMYLYFVYAHKASWQSVDNVPYIERDLQVHQVNKPWDEYQTTSTYQYRNSGTHWNAPYLSLDGSDAAQCVQDTVTVFTARPHGYMEFDITEAVQNWKSGKPNYGLLVLATNEEAEGRDLRFYSRNAQDYHPYVAVLCNGAEDAAEYLNENPTCSMAGNNGTEATVEIRTTEIPTYTSTFHNGEGDTTENPTTDNRIHVGVIYDGVEGCSCAVQNSTPRMLIESSIVAILGTIALLVHIV